MGSTSRYDNLFYGLSYFAKLASKRFGLASHNFGTSKNDSRVRAKSEDHGRA